MESSPRQQSLLATVSEQMMALEKRDWEVWLISAGVGILFGIVLLALLFRAAFPQHGSLHLDVPVSPEFFFIFVALLIAYNTYVINRRRQLRRTRQQVISTTIQSELVRLQSFTDPLTEVYNRRALDDIVRRFTSNAKRQGKPLSFMMVDIDNFRDINTRFGHLLGDFVLAEVATILRGPCAAPILWCDTEEMNSWSSSTTQTSRAARWCSIESQAALKIGTVRDT